LVGFATFYVHLLAFYNILLTFPLYFAKFDGISQQMTIKERKGART